MGSAPMKLQPANVHRDEDIAVAVGTFVEN